MNLLAPNFTTGPSGKDETRGWVFASVDGVPCFANGWDQPWRWDEGSNFFDIGSVAPTTFAVADAGGGTTFPTGTTLVYFLVFAVSSLGKETAPQRTSGVAGVSHTMAATRDATITWVDPGGEWNKARIYRRLQNSDAIKLVAEVNASTATYTDSSTDASLLTATAYVWTYRGTLPPIASWLASYGNRLWLGTGNDSNAYYAQVARTDSRFVADDFPDENILPIEPNDPYGNLVCMTQHFGVFYAKKRLAVYQVDGYDPATFTVTRLFADRGTLSPRTAQEVDGYVIDLDERGLYLWSPGAEPVVAGAATGTRESPLSPIWSRMNLDARKQFWSYVDKDAGLYFAWIALDNDPSPNYPVVYDYRNNRFMTDPYRYGTAGGRLVDAAGTEHICRVCDLGYLWQDEWSNSDGVYAGSTQGTVTTGGSTLWTCAAASFDSTVASGCVASLVERRSSAGALLDTNRVYGVTGGVSIQPLYYSTEALAAGQVLTVGAIPAVAQTPKLGMGMDVQKHVTYAVLEHEVQTGTVTISQRMDDDSFAEALVLDLSTNNGRNIVPVSNRGWKWSARFEMSKPAMDWKFLAFTMYVTATEQPR